MIQKLHIRSSKHGSKIYFASDFHLGAPNQIESINREKKICKWLEEASFDASSIFLLGDIFDFWFEYKYVVPKGSVRIQGKLAELHDRGIPVYVFTGNHDMWMFDYLEKETGIEILRGLYSFDHSGKKILMGHGDGLGPGDRVYKMIKAIFANKMCQRLFSWLPSRFGFFVAQNWSHHSRGKNIEKDKDFLGDKEFLVQFCKDMESKEHFDYYIFGHRHIPLDISINESSKYINLGEWFSHFSYATIEEGNLNLLYFKS